MLTPYAHATSVAAYTTYASAAAHTTYASAAHTTPCREKLSDREKLQANTGNLHRVSCCGSPAEVDNAAPIVAAIYFFFHTPKLFFFLTPAANPKPTTDPRPKFFFFLINSMKASPTLAAMFFFFRTPKFFYFLTPTADPKPDQNTYQPLGYHHIFGRSSPLKLSLDRSARMKTRQIWIAQTERRYYSKNLNQ